MILRVTAAVADFTDIEGQIGYCSSISADQVTSIASFTLSWAGHPAACTASARSAVSGRTLASRKA